MPQSKAIPSLGDAPEIATKLIREDFPLPPGGRPALLAAIERVISGGGVQKLTIELGQPIKVLRRVRADSPGEELPEELYEDDMMAAVMNAELDDIPIVQGVQPLEYLREAFTHFQQDKCVPKAVLVNRHQLLKAWLEVRSPGPITWLFGVEVFTHKQVPDDVLILVGAKADEPDVIAHSYRLEMNIPKEKS
jgi:hypothetical protein